MEPSWQSGLFTFGLFWSGVGWLGGFASGGGPNGQLKSQAEKCATGTRHKLWLGW